MRVILDGMGGDNAPSAIVEGAVMAASKCDNMDIREIGFLL